MRIVADDAIPGAAELFGPLGDLALASGRSLTASDLRNADALIVRSVTRVDARLLEGAHVRFVGSATSGTDHVDLEYLQSRNIRFADAAGCNAQAVAEYVLTAIFLDARRRRVDPRGQTIGIVGCGRIGSKVERLLARLGIRTLKNDPPLADAGMMSDSITLEALLPACDVVTLHVPLTGHGPHPTRDLLSASRIRALKPGATIINASRGEILDDAALYSALREARARAVLDVWRNEPAIDARLVELASFATPHLAGYTVEARRQATRLVARQLATWSGRHPNPPEFPEKTPSVTIEALADSTAADVLARICPLEAIDDSVRTAAASGTLTRDFDAIRARYAARREWSSVHVVHHDTLPPGTAAALDALGIAHA
ncbi:MAG: 4-phosphoerythronate dehydrogenase [Phycisphaerae bacterium]|nr:4-phosphoerythronate dehydrogenase [Phycisphaerae bacterium]